MCCMLLAMLRVAWNSGGVLVVHDFDGVSWHRCMTSIPIGAADERLHLNGKDIFTSRHLNGFRYIYKLCAIAEKHEYLGYTEHIGACDSIYPFKSGNDTYISYDTDLHAIVRRFSDGTIFDTFKSTDNVNIIQSVVLNDFIYFPALVDKPARIDGVGLFTCGVPRHMFGKQSLYTCGVASESVIHTYCNNSVYVRDIRMSDTCEINVNPVLQREHSEFDRTFVLPGGNSVTCSSYWIGRDNHNSISITDMRCRMEKYDLPSIDEFMNNVPVITIV